MDNPFASSDVERPDVMLWSVMDEHLAEAAYLCASYWRGLNSSTRTLRDLARYPESALLAHLDGLVIGGEDVRTHVLLPALENAADDFEQATAAALAMMESGRFAALLPFLSQPSPEVRAAVARAGSLCSHAALVPWLREQFEPQVEPTARAGLLWLAATKQTLPQSVFDALQSDDPVLVAAAASAVRFGDGARHLAIVEYLLDHPLPEVQEDALIAALAWSSHAGERRLRELALDPAQPVPICAPLLAATGKAEDHRALLALLADRASRLQALFALGFSGDAKLAVELYPFLDGKDPLEQRMAAQSLGLIFGYRAFDDDFSLGVEPITNDDDGLPPLSEDDLSADLVPSPEEELPSPNPSAIRAFCEARIEAFGDRRVLFGAPHSARQLAHVLPSLPTRLHSVLATALFVRSGGRLALDMRGRTAAQLAQLTAVR